MLALGNESLMNRTGQQVDAAQSHLVAEVLAGHANPCGAGRTQDINIPIVPLLSGKGISSRFQPKAGTSAVVAADSRRQGRSKTAMSFWGVLWAAGGMKDSNRHAAGQLLQGQQAIPVEFLGHSRGREWRQKCRATAFSIPTCSRAAKKFSDHLPTP